MPVLEEFILGILVEHKYSECLTCWVQCVCVWSSPTAAEEPGKGGWFGNCSLPTIPAGLGS